MLQDIDHVYYTSKIYGSGDAAGKELWLNVSRMEEDQQKACGFLSTTHRQAEVRDQWVWVNNWCRSMFIPIVVGLMPRLPSFILL